MSCRHGGAPLGKKQRACRACLQDVILQLRWKVESAKLEMEKMSAAGGEAALKRLQNHDSVIGFLNRCRQTMGYIMRHAVLDADVERYLEGQISELGNYLKEEHRG